MGLLWLTALLAFIVAAEGRQACAGYAEPVNMPWVGPFSARSCRRFVTCCPDLQWAIDRVCNTGQLYDPAEGACKSTTEGCTDMITRKAVAVASQEAAAFCSQQATARRALTSEQPAIVELMPQPAYFGKPLTILYRGTATGARLLVPGRKEMTGSKGQALSRPVFKNFNLTILSNTAPAAASEAAGQGAGTEAAGRLIVVLPTESDLQAHADTYMISLFNTETHGLQPMQLQVMSSPGATSHATDADPAAAGAAGSDTAADSGSASSASSTGSEQQQGSSAASAPAVGPLNPACACAPAAAAAPGAPCPSHLTPMTLHLTTAGLLPADGGSLASLAASLGSKAPGTMVQCVPPPVFDSPSGTLRFSYCLRAICLPDLAEALALGTGQGQGQGGSQQDGQQRRLTATLPMVEIHDGEAVAPGAVAQLQLLNPEGVEGLELSAHVAGLAGAQGWANGRQLQLPSAGVRSLAIRLTAPLPQAPQGKGEVTWGGLVTALATLQKPAAQAQGQTAAAAAGAGAAGGDGTGSAASAPAASGPNDYHASVALQGFFPGTAHQLSFLAAAVGSGASARVSSWSATFTLGLNGSEPALAGGCKDAAALQARFEAAVLKALMPSVGTASGRAAAAEAAAAAATTGKSSGSSSSGGARGSPRGPRVHVSCAQHKSMLYGGSSSSSMLAAGTGAGSGGLSKGSGGAHMGSEHPTVTTNVLMLTIKAQLPAVPGCLLLLNSSGTAGGSTAASSTQQEDELAGLHAAQDAVAAMCSGEAGCMGVMLPLTVRATSLHINLPLALPQAPQDSASQGGSSNSGGGGAEGRGGHRHPTTLEELCLSVHSGVMGRLSSFFPAGTLDRMGNPACGPLVLTGAAATTSSGLPGAFAAGQQWLGGAAGSLHASLVSATTAGSAAVRAAAAGSGPAFLVGCGVVSLLLVLSVALFLAKRRRHAHAGHLHGLSSHPMEVKLTRQVSPTKSPHHHNHHHHHHHSSGSTPGAAGGSPHHISPARDAKARTSAFGKAITEASVASVGATPFAAGDGIASASLALFGSGNAESLVHRPHAHSAPGEQHQHQQGHHSGSTNQQQQSRRSSADGHDDVPDALNSSWGFVYRHQEYKQQIRDAVAAAQAGDGEGAGLFGDGPSGPHYHPLSEQRPSAFGRIAAAIAAALVPQQQKPTQQERRAQAAYEAKPTGLTSAPASIHDHDSDKESVSDAEDPNFFSLKAGGLPASIRAAVAEAKAGGAGGSGAGAGAGGSGGGAGYSMRTMPGRHAYGALWGTSSGGIHHRTSPGIAGLTISETGDDISLGDYLPGPLQRLGSLGGASNASGGTGATGPGGGNNNLLTPNALRLPRMSEASEMSEDVLISPGSSYIPSSMQPKRLSLSTPHRRAAAAHYQQQHQQVQQGTAQGQGQGPGQGQQGHGPGVAPVAVVGSLGAASSVGLHTVSPRAGVGHDSVAGSLGAHGGTSSHQLHFHLGPGTPTTGMLHRGHAQSNPGAPSAGKAAVGSLGAAGGTGHHHQSGHPPLHPSHPHGGPGHARQAMLSPTAPKTQQLGFRAGSNSGGGAPPSASQQHDAGSGHATRSPTKTTPSKSGGGSSFRRKSEGGSSLSRSPSHGRGGGGSSRTSPPHAILATAAPPPAGPAPGAPSAGAGASPGANAPQASQGEPGAGGADAGKSSRWGLFS